MDCVDKELADGIEKIKKTGTMRATIQCIEALQRNRQFTIGDYVVEADDNGQPRSNDGLGVPHRYQVVARDELGLTYAKKVLKGGKLGALFCLDWQWQKTYMVDPALVQSILLNSPYSPSAEIEEARKLRKQNTLYNKSIMYTGQDYDEASKWMQDNLKVGTTVWIQHYPNDNYMGTAYKAVVARISKRRLAINDWADQHTTERYNVSHTVTVDLKTDELGVRGYETLHLISGHIGLYLTEPKPVIFSNNPNLGPQ